MRWPKWFTLGDAKTVFVSPSKLALGILVAALTSYTTEAITVDWPIIGILCGICYLNGLIRYLDALGTEEQR